MGWDGMGWDEWNGMEWDEWMDGWMVWMDRWIFCLFHPLAA